MVFPKKIFYGWILVFISMVLSALGLGMFISTNSLFVKPVCEYFGFARGQFTLCRTIITLTGALAMPIYGRIIQKVGVKKVLMAGALMLGLVTIGYSFSASLWHFYLFSLVNGLFYNSISFMSIGVLISAWFDGKKGLATGLAFSGSGIGGAVMIPVIGKIIETAGWQWAYRFMGLVGISVLMPVIIIFVKNSPQDMGLRPFAPDVPKEKNQAPVENLSYREALGTPKLWLLVTALFFINFFAAATNTHSAPYLSDLGYTRAYVSGVISLFMIFLTVGKIILGLVYDRFGARAGNSVISVFCLGFPIFAYLAHIPGIPWVYAVFVGMASCGVSVPVSILVIRYFGEKEFPAIFSFCMMITYLSPSVSVPAMGAVFDLTGSYKPAWIAFFIGSIIITSCFILMEKLHKPSP